MKALPLIIAALLAASALPVEAGRRDGRPGPGPGPNAHQVAVSTPLNEHTNAAIAAAKGEA